MSKTQVLIVASNPDSSTPLNLMKEVREIESSIRSSYYRDAFEVHHCHAARASDLRRKVLDVHPEIVHFCAHGSHFGVYLENDFGSENLVFSEQLVAFLCKVGTVKCIVFNSCHSFAAGKQASKHFPAVICFNGKLADKAAISFSKGFYDSIARGDEVKNSYDVGVSSISMDFESSDPRLAEEHRSLYLDDKSSGANHLANGYCIFINEKAYETKSSYFYAVVLFLTLLLSLIYIFKKVII